MMQPINLPALTKEYRHSVAPLLERIAVLDKMIDSMEISTEKQKIAKRRAGLWSMVLDTQYLIREMEMSSIKDP